jgi:murein DD-endopeptidase MepM/ murein hydrolase activator NlpD
MSKTRRYIFNPLTLSYEIQRDSNFSGLAKTLIFFGVTLVVTLMFFAVHVSLGFELPKTAILRKSNAKLTSRIAVLNRQLDQHNEALEALRMRDDGIYRSIFGMNPIPPEVRNAGFNGINRYSEYDGSLKKVAQKMDQLMKKTYIQSKSFDEVALLSRRADEMASCIPAIPPMVPDQKIYRFSSGFGPRLHPVYNSYKMHTGVDLVMNSGTPIYATGDGVVHTVKSEATGYGRQIVIDHGFGYKSRYAHMSELLLKVGTPVKRGDLIGLSGNTGTSTGAHLHYEVMYKDAQVNPANYFDLSITPQEYAVMVPQSVKEETK